MRRERSSKWLVPGGTVQYVGLCSAYAEVLMGEAEGGMMKEAGNLG